MVNRTKIEWTEVTWNPVTGCTKISPGCRNCYAERMAKRLAGRCGYPQDEPFRVALHPERLDEPLRWKKPRRVFVCSMGDLFHDDVPTWMRFEVLDIVLQAKQHTFLILTKRPANMKEYFDWYYTKCGRTTETIKNLWLGVTAENQKAADERIPILLQIPAAVRFISCEPLLGPVNLSRWLGTIPGWTGKNSCLPSPLKESLECLSDIPPTSGIDWVICGGETGPGARPCHPDWVRSLRDQCQAAKVPFFFKSWGEYIVPEDGARSCRVCGCTEHNACEGGCWWVEDDLCSNCAGQPTPNFRAVKYQRVGKKRAGRILDGRTWDEMPITKGAV